MIYASVETTNHWVIF